MSSGRLKVVQKQLQVVRTAFLIAKHSEIIYKEILVIPQKIVSVKFEFAHGLVHLE